MGIPRDALGSNVVGKKIKRIEWDRIITSFMIIKSANDDKIME